jgi:hypothetical protein
MPEPSVATALIIIAFSVLIVVAKLPNWARPDHEREAEASIGKT